MPDTSVSRTSATVVPDSGPAISGAAHDPLHSMITIAKDDVLSDADKSCLIGVAHLCKQWLLSKADRLSEVAC